MKWYPLLALAFVAVLFSCKENKSKNNTTLNPANLNSTFISLISDSAYILKTPKGAILKIEMNSFDVGANTRVRLEVKEAYSIQDILLAGLTTESNGKPLQSGGMIYINAIANGEEVKLIKPIKVSIPAKFYDYKMQLFKGEVKDDSSINWVDPQPLDSSPLAKQLIWGRELFKANCASCHKPYQDFTGPPLAGCRDREPNKEWAYRFIDNVNTLSEKDPYAIALFRKYGSKMTQFNLKKEEIKAILDYCDNEGLQNPMPEKVPVVISEPADTTNSSESKRPCGYDTIYRAKEDTSIQILPIDTSDFNTLPVDMKNQTAKPGKAETTEGFRKGFNDQNQTDGMYDFEIKTFGWYNVDFFVEGYAGTTYVRVNVQLQMQYEFDMHVYLFCPDKKMLSVAYDKVDGSYTFDKVKGKIPLFLNDKAIILAFGSRNDKMFYGTATFNVQAEQTTIIKVKETNEEELKSFIEKNNIEGIKIDVKKKDDFEIIEKPCNGTHAVDSGRQV